MGEGENTMHYVQCSKQIQRKVLEDNTVAKAMVAPQLQLL